MKPTLQEDCLERNGIWDKEKFIFTLFYIHFSILLKVRFCGASFRYFPTSIHVIFLHFLHLMFSRHIFSFSSFFQCHDVTRNISPNFDHLCISKKKPNAFINSYASVMIRWFSKDYNVYSNISWKLSFRNFRIQKSYNTWIDL